MAIKCLTSLLFIVTCVAGQCYTVLEGDYYVGALDIPNWWGFRYTDTMQVQFTSNMTMVEYIFNPDNALGTRCQNSWNKLYGASRCGYLHPHHEDSDRFVWRRHPDCLIYNGSYVIGEKPDCPYKDNVQIAAYAYDLGNKPFENSSLLTIFETLLNVTVEYTIEIEFGPTWGTYNLYTSKAEGMKLLETNTIKHTYCEDYDRGYNLGLYFGGECAAPMDIICCYDDYSEI